MTKLIPLSQIPHKARKIERDARRRYASRTEALIGAQYKIVSAPGCHSRPYFDPPVIGWMVSGGAASIVADQVVNMPGGTSHHPYAVETL